MNDIDEPYIMLDGNTEWVRKEDYDAERARRERAEQALRSLVDGTFAGMYENPYQRSECAYCGCVYPDNHNPDCPIAQGRAYFEARGEGSEDGET